ncbi:MAG: hypothetical protein LH475_08110 [Cryobacterium sp.]|uniref:hypothetical protein n=1 Tax=unclassified Cryobacterium TaxID=2649013 RepID=UPI0018CB3C09|nr:MULTISPECIES: hypothetical protein [unclassified Cryobacterium]MCY7404574.1 hypothetical protein [Cryobacterium sp.]
MKSTPPARFIPDGNRDDRHTHPRFVAALLSAATLVLAIWLAFNTSDGESGTTRLQLLVAVAALALLIIGITFHLAAAAAGLHGGIENGGAQHGGIDHGGIDHGGVDHGVGQFDTDRFLRISRRILVLSRIGAVFAAAAVLAIAGLGALRVLAPPAERPVSVQFSEITGRVQLEYCPNLPGSFDALVKPTDLASSSTLLPVWVASRVCGNPSFQHGVWLHLNRSTITVADAGYR